MKYDFDKEIDRKNTDSIKYDFSRYGISGNVTPMWVADMDFRSPPAVISAMKKRVEHGIFGYGETDDSYFEAVRKWFSQHFGWEVKRDWLIKTPGVVFSICAAIRAFTNEGDPVLIQQPVYYPFADCVVKNNRKLFVNELSYDMGRYSMDYWDFESLIIRNNIKLFILCSPHNPVGRVWTVNELTRIGDICRRHGVTVVSDEIHQDIVCGKAKHNVFASIKPAFSEMTVTCTAPSKTFNIPGLQIANIFIENEMLREKFRAEVVNSGYIEANIMGAVACRAAYEEGGEWLDELIEYLKGNILYLREFVLAEIPGIHVIKPEGTYLAWLDCRELGLGDKKLDKFMIEKAGIWLDPGHIFGRGGNAPGSKKH